DWPAFTDVLYVNAAGREQLRVSRLGLNLVGTDVEHADDPLVKAARAQSVAYGAVYFRDGSEPYVTIARAEAGGRRGVLMAEMNLKFIWDVISRIRVGEGGRAYVVAADGTLIAHPDITLVLRKTDFSQLAQVRAALSTPVAASSMIAEDSTGKRVLTAY